MTDAELSTLKSGLELQSIFIQGLLAGELRDQFSAQELTRCCVLCLIPSYLVLGLATNPLQLYLIMTPLVFALSILSATLSASMTTQVPSSDTGMALGFNFAVQSIIPTVSPSLAELLMTYTGVPMFGVCAAGSSLFLLFYVVWWS